MVGIQVMEIHGGWATVVPAVLTTAPKILDSLELQLVLALESFLFAALNTITV